MGEVMTGAFLGESAIWIEVLGRHGDVALRQRFTSTPITIGRAYDNDVVVDDLHVAAHHPASCARMRACSRPRISAAATG